MSDEEARLEVEDIKATIAKEKGFDPEKEDPEKKEDAEEPDHQDEDDNANDDKSKQERQDPADVGEKDVDPESPKTRGETVPLSKFQETKKTLEAKAQDLQSQVETLTEQLNRDNTEKSIGDKVKKFAEKTGMDESAVLDLVAMVRGESALDKDTKEVIEKSALALKKAEAQEQFDSEISAFLAEFPDAADHERELRTKALEKGNLDKSLFEVFNRFVKPDITTKKKTGESGRGSSRSSAPTFDLQKVIEKVSNGTPKPFEGLTKEQEDQVFDYMEKTGSRYNGRSK